MKVKDMREENNMKQFRVICEDLISDWFYCKDFTIEVMNNLRKIFNKYGEWNIEYREMK